MMPNQFGSTQPFGFGQTAAPTNPLISSLLSKIAEGSAQFAPQQSLATRGAVALPPSQLPFGQNSTLARIRRTDQPIPEATLPTQAAIDRFGIASVQASRLAGLAEKGNTSTSGSLLRHRVQEARQSNNPGQSLWNLGVAMYRQDFINGLAKAVAETNRDRKNNSRDPADSLLVDDPKQIAMVYQTLVSKELGLRGFEDLRSKLDNGSSEYMGIFGGVVAPSNYDTLRNQLLDALATEEEQLGGANVADSIEKRSFWKEFRRDLRRSEKHSSRSSDAY